MKVKYSKISFEILTNLFVVKIVITYTITFIIVIWVTVNTGLKITIITIIIRWVASRQMCISKCKYTRCEINIDKDVWVRGRYLRFYNGFK